MKGGRRQSEGLTRSNEGHSQVLKDSGWRGAGSWRNYAIADCRAPADGAIAATQFGTEPTSLALLALHSSSSASTVPREELEPLLACQRPNGLWPAVGNGTAGVQFLGNRHGSQHADDFGRCSRDVRRVARQVGLLPAVGGFMAGPFEVPALRPASSVRSERSMGGRGFQTPLVGWCRHQWH